MKAQRSNDEDDGGLDALLDTMTNVVGILVLVLIVTQLSVADVVTRLTEENTIDEQAVEEVRQELVLKQTEQQELERILVDPLNIDAEKQREELKKNQELLERRKLLLAEKKKQQNEFALKMEADQQQAKKNSKEIADNKQQREQLASTITTAQDKLASLQAMLDETPDVAAPADIQVSIPNPRPAPPGSKQLIFLCTQDRLYPVNLDPIRADAQQKAKAIIARFNLNQNPAAGIDPEKFKKYYENLKAQDEFFDIEYYVQADRYPRMRFVPREGGGASKKELVNPRSRIRTKWLSSIDVNKYYARFYVLPDSFDVYVTSRRLFSESGMLAGWEPQSADWVFTTSIGGGIELGPPPEKKPTPPPPTTPVKPPNVID